MIAARKSLGPRAASRPAPGRLLSLAVLAAAAALAGCADDEDPRLPGERIAIRPSVQPGGEVTGETRPIPAAETRADWPQVGGDAGHAGGHPAGPSSPSLAWRVSAGPGAEDRLTDSGPVIADGVIFLRDGEAGVRAFDAGSGRRRWDVDLTPDGESSATGFGGGLAVVGDRLYVTNGFGLVAALNVADGAEIWRHQAQAPIHSAPVVAGGKVIAVTRANKAVALNAEDGSVAWTKDSGLNRAGNLGGSAPAATENVVALPYGSGELVLARTESGATLWSATLVSPGKVEGMAAFPDVTSAPALGPGPSVVAANAGGAMALFDGRNGRRVWQLDFGSMSPVWEVADTLYAVTSEPSVVRVDIGTGDIMWRAPLETWEDPEDREIPIGYGGPVLAGGRVLVTSSDGRLMAFDPQTGAPGAVIEMPGGSRTGVAAAGGTLYVHTVDGDLLAYR
ncbi:Outer membrane protein assembly factor BamB, contains PQQ-like beta-propeller repeat [Albimonas donghaensis]|uniref:Outer membrane protein assembly factor BamB, contains PQQ-like beta-propeller repeat n=1 Tax=Albimonas donghaensis TaxID=356660 RepID=A0A1H2T188_9RHOB|nr:PQQ-like beta-propeller repeat protein [Albimonas donghaensis]SDW37059.1 Outer membrane protein assembly factor BamB, contains PQQ-like beta-propeller repeat [Albimonas donghaensis]